MKCLSKKLVAAFFFLIVSQPVKAQELDHWAAWLEQHQLTRMDWFVFNATRILDLDFIHPEVNSQGVTVSIYPAYEQFWSNVKSLSVSPVRTFASFDFVDGLIWLTIVVKKQEPRQEDCAVLLRTFRNTLLSGLAPDHVDAKTTDDERAIYGSRLMEMMLSTPSHIGAQEPAGLSEHMSSITKLRAVIEKMGSQNFVGDFTCEGRLTGREVMVELK